MSESPAVPSIVTELPGPRARAWIERDHRVVSQHYAKDYPLVVADAAGMVVTDPDGNRFLDFAAGIAVCATGHCHPQVVAAIREQAGKLLHMCPTDWYTTPVVELAERLSRIAPIPDARVFFTNSGAEAVESAIKLARLVTGRPKKIIAFFGGFHGRTMGAATLTSSKAVQRRGYSPMLPEVHHSYYAQCYRCPVGRVAETCDVECLDHLDLLFDTIAPPDEVAAIVVEPIQGEGGYYVPKPEFLQRVAARAREHGILLIADEVQSGMGRSGKMFACEHFGIEPDIMTLAKGIASGMPLAAVLARDSVMRWNSGGHGSTYGGNAVSCAAAVATLDLLEDGLVENTARVGARLRELLDDLSSRHDTIGDVRGLGLMLAIDLVDASLVDQVLLGAFEKGLLLLGCGHSAVRLTPPLIATEEDAATAVSILDEVLGAL